MNPRSRRQYSSDGRTLHRKSDKLPARRKQIIAWLHRLIATAVCLIAGGSIAAEKRPNIVVILADDLGYGDPHCYNPDSRLATPHLDRLAAGGLRFTDAHTPSSVCTPTRYALLTGRYSWRTRLKSSVLDGFSPPLIEPDRLTLPAFLRRQGYATACIGKWHLGMQWTRKDGSDETRDRATPPGGFRSGEEIDLTVPVRAGPLTAGFDSFFGISASLDMPPYCWIENDRCRGDLSESLPDSRELFMSVTRGLKAPEFALDRVLPTFKTRATEWIARHVAGAPDKPFFLYLPLNSPHLPVVPSGPFVGRSGIGLYGDFVLETDDFVGGVVAALKTAGVLERTMIVVTSDNGGIFHTWEPQEADDVSGYTPTPRGRQAKEVGHRSNRDWRGTKADVYEGGHRVPFIVHWPERVKPGVTATPVELTDIFATVAEAVAVALPTEAAPDSFSFFRVLRERGPGAPTRPFLVHHSLMGNFALRQGEWKFMERRGSGGFSSPKVVSPKSGESAGQLYHLREDPQETKNRYLDEPGRVRHFEQLLAKIRATSGTRTLAVP